MIIVDISGSPPVILHNGIRHLHPILYRSPLATSYIFHEPSPATGHDIVLKVIHDIIGKCR